MSKNKNIEFGFRAITEAIRAGKEIDKVLIKQNLSGDLFNELFALIREHGIPFQYVPQEKLNNVSRGSHQGVIAMISSVEYRQLDDLLPWIYERGESPLILILDRITDVRNFGAIARSAECAGVHAVVISERGSAPVNSDAVKTSAGALSHLNICRTDSLREAIIFLKESGVHVIAATEKGSEIYYKANYKGPIALIMGCEERGVSQELLKLADEEVKIPVLGKIESLNVSVAASVILYEAVRQRTFA